MYFKRQIATALALRYLLTLFNRDSLKFGASIVLFNVLLNKKYLS